MYSIEATKKHIYLHKNQLLAKRRFIISEDDLLSLILEKDERGFNLLYDNYSPALFGIIHKILRDDALAQDVIQDTFIKIWNNISRYDSQKGTLFTWMLNIGRNLAIDKLRSAAYIHSKQSESVDNYVGMENGNLSETMETDYIGITSILEKLKPEQRQVVDVLYYQGYSQSEAAEKLGIPLGTIKTRAKSALTALKNWLDQ
ncbi:MAG: sigma-70 family RNA polymerase sigma factor [Cytophagales bacterium]|nr:sigma-70 family RNA polymerase sigma factor [Cytophagales bacterium]